MMRGFWTTTSNLSRVHSGPVSLDPTQNPIVSPCSQCIWKDAFNSTQKLGPVIRAAAHPESIYSSRHQGKEPRTAMRHPGSHRRLPRETQQRSRAHARIGHRPADLGRSGMSRSQLLPPPPALRPHAPLGPRDIGIPIGGNLSRTTLRRAGLINARDTALMLMGCQAAGGFGGESSFTAGRSADPANLPRAH